MTNGETNIPWKTSGGIGDLVIATWTLVALETVLGDPGAWSTPSNLQEGRGAGSQSPKVTAALNLLLEGRYLESSDNGLAWSDRVGQFLAREGIEVSLAHVRATLLQAGSAINGDLGGHGREQWTMDADVIRSQGTRSRRIVNSLIDSLTQSDPSFHERLSATGARFLDVGSGAGEIAVEMVNAFPNMHAVALEPASAALAVLRENVERSGFASRIDVRQGRLEEISEETLYDLVWVPLDFIDPDIVEEAIFRARNLLLTGGWLALATPSSIPSLSSAAARLRTALWGGSDLNGATLIRLLESLGLESIYQVQYASSVELVVSRWPERGPLTTIREPN